MSNQVNWELVGKMVRGRDRESVVAELDAFFALREQDQEKVKAAIDEVLRARKLHEFARKPDLIGIVVNKLAGDSFDASLRDSLAERASEVLGTAYKMNPRKGIINPHYEAPAPTSQQLALSGNVR